MNVAHLSNDDLMSGLCTIAAEGRIVLAKLLVYLGEVEARKLYREMGCSSMFKFCVERLSMSEGEAQRRLVGARIARDYPAVLEGIARGDLNLTNIELLQPHLTPENHSEILQAAVRKTKLQVQELIAARNPRPDAPALLSAMPAVAQSEPPTTPKASTVVMPLSAERYKVQVTISKELRDKIDEVKDLMRHRNPSGELEIIFEQGIELLRSKLLKERTSKGVKGVKAAVRRETFARDGMQCTYVSPDGHRCTEHGYLEVDHVHARACGGSDDASNLRVLCRAHNLLWAEQTFGREIVEKKIHLRQRRWESGTLSAALKKLGFRETEVRRATSLLGRRFDEPIEVVVRDAIGMLTSGA